VDPSQTLHPNPPGQETIFDESDDGGEYRRRYAGSRVLRWYAAHHDLVVQPLRRGIRESASGDVKISRNVGLTELSDDGRLVTWGGKCWGRRHWSWLLVLGRDLGLRLRWLRRDLYSGRLVLTLTLLSDSSAKDEAQVHTSSIDNHWRNSRLPGVEIDIIFCFRLGILLEASATRKVIADKAHRFERRGRVVYAGSKGLGWVL
jgi:hypothetical protein